MGLLPLCRTKGGYKVATLQQVLELRLLIDEPEDSEVYTDEYLGELIDDKGGVATAAQFVWTQKAAKFASLVDMSESGSSRKLSQMHRSALEMAESFRPKRGGYTMSIPIERV